MEIDGHTVELSNLEKEMYPETGFTKAQLIDYYSRISLILLPHLEDRPVTLARYPDGVEEDHFFERECPVHPEWVDIINIPTKSRPGGIDYCVINNLATLVWLSNLATLEFHTFPFKGNDIEKPSYAVFDLDPLPPATIVDCAWVALRIRNFLEDRGIKCFPKTSGRKGIHAYVPLNGTADFELSQGFVKKTSAELEMDYPKRITLNRDRSERKGKVFIDWSQNDSSKSTCAVYSLRGTEKPQVSAPLSWGELEDAVQLKDATVLSFEPWEVLQRAVDNGDLYAPVLELRQELPR